MQRRQILLGTAATVALGLGAAPLSRAADAAPKEFRIGYQKNGVLVVAKQQQRLEKRLEPLGINVRWVEFPSGPPLLEALNAGAIEFGTTGDVPPVFAQAAGADLLYVAAQPGDGESSAIIVPPNSPLQSVADLKGKRLAFTKGSSAHNLTVAALDQAGLTYADIIPVYLSPADAVAALEQGAVDAWTIWDPFYAIAQQRQHARVLLSGKGVLRSNSFFLADRGFTETYPKILDAVLQELRGAAEWSRANPEQLAKVQSQITGVPIEITRVAFGRVRIGVEPLTPELVTEQQAVADRFLSLGLIPKPVKVADVVWQWHADA